MQQISLPELGLPSIPTTMEDARFGLDLVRNFGFITALRASRRKHTQTEIHEPTLSRQPHPLLRPLHLRPTLSDMYGYTEIYVQDSYALPGVAKQCIGDGVVVDLGAYNGDSAAYFASSFPDKSVIAIEPNVRNYTILQKNAAQYKGRIKPVHAAVAPIGGRIGSVIFDSKPNDMVHSFTPDHDSPDGLSAAAITPDDIISMTDGANIDLLKIDIEGAEKQLMASRNIDQLLRRTQILLIETHDRFVPGATAAVKDATTRNGLRQITGDDNHTTIFINGSHNLRD